MSQPLRYGLNPHQTPASYEPVGDALPFRVLNGQPGYINLLDALNSWQLVRELRAATGLAAAASFKHVSPAGAAVAMPLSDALRAAYLIDAADDLSPAATAYVRARGGDLTSAYGDFAAVSETVDLSLARTLRREVSDGIIAPAYDADALAMLREKKGGRYLILEAHAAFEPPPTERRELFGVRLEQPADVRPIGDALFENVVTQQREFPPAARRDLIIATIALRYTQSNSVCVASDGQVIGLGAGQQSRIHCTRLACGKADRWMLQQHPRVLEAPLHEGLRRADRINAREQYIHWAELSEPERTQLAAVVDPLPPPLSESERAEWITSFHNVLSHDAFIPFRDNIDRCQASAVRHLLQPGGSIADADVIAAADAYGIAMALTNHRLFRH